MRKSCVFIFNFQYFLHMQKKKKIQDFKLHVGNFWGNFFIVKKCISWAY